MRRQRDKMTSKLEAAVRASRALFGKLREALRAVGRVQVTKPN